MTIYHKHHIIPKHMGGSDDPSNLIILTVEEHANAHKQLFEQFGYWQDELAWKGLRKMHSKQEILEKIMKENHPWKGKKHKPETIIKIKNSQPKTHNLTNEGREKIVASNKRRNQNLICPHCGKIGRNERAMKQWHYTRCKYQFSSPAHTEDHLPVSAPLA